MSDLHIISLFVKGHLNFKTTCNSLNDNSMQFQHPTHICHKPFVFDQFRKNLLEFTVLSRRNWQIINKISLEKFSVDPHSHPHSFVLQCFRTCLLECGRIICLQVKAAFFTETCTVWFPCSCRQCQSEASSSQVMSAFEAIAFLQVVEMETAFTHRLINTVLQISCGVTVNYSWRPCFRALQSEGPSITAGHLCLQNAHFFLWDNKILPAATAGEHRKHLKYLTWSAKDA